MNRIGPKIGLTQHYFFINTAYCSTKHLKHLSRTGITLETFWMRLRTRVDPSFPLALDDHSKPLIWQYTVQSEEVQFFELPEPRDMPLLRCMVEDTNPLTGATTVTEHNEV